jgi:hypothetical protein
MTMGQDFDEQVRALATQVNERVQQLGADQPGSQPISRSEQQSALIQAELGPIEEAVGEDAASFWRKFRSALRRDLCEEGGMLYSQYRAFHDVASSDLVKYSAGVLALWGVSSGLLPTAIVIVSALTLHLGVRSVCDE